MQRGSALHAVIERSIRAASRQDEPTIPPEIVKAIVNEVLADPEYHGPDRGARLSAREAPTGGARSSRSTRPDGRRAGDAVRDGHRRLPGAGKIDYAELMEEGAAVAVRDWKSSRALPAYEEIARKRPTGRWRRRTSSWCCTRWRWRSGCRCGWRSAAVQGRAPTTVTLRPRRHLDTGTPTWCRAGVRRGSRPRRGPGAVPRRVPRPTVRPRVRLPRHRGQATGRMASGP
jgi:hypothetical protein